MSKRAQPASPKPTPLIGRPETAQEEGLRHWFDAQALEAPKNIEEAARLIITLVTSLLGILFGILTLASDKLPAYLAFTPSVTPALHWPRALGIVAVGAWLVAVGTALAVVWPRPYTVANNDPAAQSAIFTRLLRFKARALRVAGVAFGVGLVALGLVVVLAFLAA